MDYEQLRRLAQEATPGPWEFHEELDGYWWVVEPTTPSPYVPIVSLEWYRLPDAPDGNLEAGQQRRADFTFIAAAREAVPALLDERDRLAAEVVALREALGWYQLEAEALCRNLARNKEDAVMASLNVLSLDGGERAKRVLTNPSPAVAEVLRLVELGRLRSGDFPRVVCLCGSIRFPDAWKQAYRGESLAGHIVLAVGVMVWAGDEPIRDNSPTKAMLDDLHKRKIDLADEVLVLNVGGYIGESTRSEIDYAIRRGKPVRYLEAQDGEQKMVRVESRPFHFRCDCGSNVFTHVVELDTYQCNACGAVYQGER